MSLVTDILDHLSGIASLKERSAQQDRVLDRAAIRRYSIGL